ncbi:AbiTii domain-containing protein [Corynebacterium casei]|uniref:AbiTii domain-containing protein n=1 Tax=Corynebacterium casei TaxID=160386 RepID=UPI003FD31DB5
MTTPKREPSQVLDEDASLAGLLRKCLFLGTQTGSDRLRSWALNELEGYPDDNVLPEYRSIRGLPLVLKSQSGYSIVSGQIVHRPQVPPYAQKHLPEQLTLLQPVEELEQLAKLEHLKMTQPELSLVQTLWNEELPQFQDIIEIHYDIPGSHIKGIIGQIRTKLVVIVAELTANSPLQELPSKEKVDSVMTNNFGNVYNMTINDNNGDFAIGDNSTVNKGFDVEEVQKLIQQVLNAATQSGQADKELEDAATELESTLLAESPAQSVVMQKLGKLQGLAEKIGVSSVTAAVTELVGYLVLNILPH